MIEVKIKSREASIMGDGMDLIRLTIPERVSMQWNGHGSFTYRAFKNIGKELIITREERDIWGIVTNVLFANVPSGEECLWDNREKYIYGSI